MKKILIKTAVKKILADMYTPIGMYLRLRDRFRGTVLLESTDHHVAENSYSFIGINAIAGIEVKDKTTAEFKLPDQQPQVAWLENNRIDAVLWSLLQRFEGESEDPRSAEFAQGMYGYCTVDAVQLFETVKLHKPNTEESIPLARYRMYQY